MGGRTSVRQCPRSQEGLGGSPMPRQTGRETRTWRALWPGLAGERSLQRELHTRARGYHDVTILGLDGALGADGASDHAADDRGLGAATDQPTSQRAGRRTDADLGDVTRVGLAVPQRAIQRLGRRLDRIALSRDLDRVRREGELAGLVALVLRLVDLGDRHRDLGAGRNPDGTLA